MKELSKILITLSLFLTCVAYAGELYFIDAHSQIDHETDIDLVIKRMRQNGVRRTILAARSKRKGRDIVELAESYPSYITAALRTKGGAYRRNENRYYKKLARRNNSGNYNAMAEVMVYHAQKGNKAPEVKIKLNDKRVQTALAVARENGWPFVIHIEFASLGKKKRRSFMSRMEKLLRQYPKQVFVLIHMGQLDASEVGRLIQAYKNIYFLTSHADPVTVSNSSQPWVNMFKGKSFKSEWKQLMIEHPARFIFALDNVWADHWQTDYGVKMHYWRKALSELPTKTAHAIAHGNAERLWGLRTN